MKIPADRPAAIVLGIMQDAGMPHIGCRCRRCAAAYEDPSLSQYAACLAVVDPRRQPAGVWLIDATPDIRYQLNALGSVLGPHPARPDRLRRPEAIFLTHAHMGHTAGLAELGPEGMHAQGLPVYGPAGVVDALRRTRLWQPLVGLLELAPLPAGEPFSLAPDLTITPISVPHRDELSAGTFTYHIQGPERALLYLPDIDAWHLWPEAGRVLAGVDAALVDASFYGREEAAAVHPLVPETLAFFAGLPCSLVLTHINHTNPILDEGGDERQSVAAAGARIAHFGQLFVL